MYTIQTQHGNQCIYTETLKLWHAQIHAAHIIYTLSECLDSHILPVCDLQRILLDGV